MQRHIHHKQFSSTIIQSKFESWKKSINPPQTIHTPTNTSSPAGRRLISCYQLQIKTRPRELLFPRNKKKNFQPSNLPFHSQPFSSPFPALLSLSSPAITAKAAVLKSRLLFVEGDKRGRERFRVNVGEGWKAAGNSARTARRPRDFLRSSGFCSRRTRCNLKRDEEAKQTGEGRRRLCPIPSSNLVSANPMLGQRKRQRSRDYYVVLAGIGVTRCCIPLPIAILRNETTCLRALRHWSILNRVIISPHSFPSSTGWFEDRGCMWSNWFKYGFLVGWWRMVEDMLRRNYSRYFFILIFEFARGFGSCTTLDLFLLA